jgi:acyl-CoA reductase-like NAD-dependent aldehyde dehydrogenase
VADVDPDLRALQDVRDCVARAVRAQAAVAHATQAEVDRWCEAMAQAGAKAAHALAKLAVEETGIGRVHYKILKNLLGTEGAWASIKDEKTAGIVTRDERRGVVEIATPVGVIAGIVPTTNPTSTALFKALIAVKGRNAIVISPHPRARRCIGESAEVLRRALERAGAPADLVQSLANPTIESTGALMKHADVSMILATGGSGLVTAAYSSGKPAYGVGPGNVPCYVDRSADLGEAARWLVESQSFDNGTLCCSEQGVVLDRPIAEAMLAALRKRGAHVCSAEETAKLAKLCNVRGHMNPDVVGLDPAKIARMAGFAVPEETTLLLAPQDGVGKEHPLSIEILAPILSVHHVDGWREGCAVSMAMLEFGGLGHTLGLWARDREVLEAWFLEKPANRIVVNGPTSQGAVGYSTNLVPSMSLGCGPQAGNITSDNISARHLINVKRAAFPRKDWDALWARDHARAAQLGGERAPRGSGLPGDPGLRGGGEPAGPRGAEFTDSEPRSNWTGNPPVLSRPESAPARARVDAPRPAPRFTAAPGTTIVPARPPVNEIGSRASSARTAEPPPIARAGARTVARTAPARGSVHAGTALSPQEILGILSHAGSGCPLGPCLGCRHHDVQSGSCTA